MIKTAIIVGLMSTPAYAGDQYVCALWARAQNSVDFSTTNDVDMLTADEGFIALRLDDLYGSCILQPKLRPGLEGDRSTNVYIAGIMAILQTRISQVGTEPAGSDPTPASPKGDEEWKAQCRYEYNSWDEETGTVVRHGSPERVRCPCGNGVTCGG